MLTVPYIKPVEKPVSQGLVIKICGLTPANARRFNINFQCGPSINPRDDVAFHLAADLDSQCCIMNNILQNQWGPQECETRNFPFHKGVEFVIEVKCEASEFQVKVNNNRLLNFEHRLEPSRITYLSIDGDIILHKIDYLNNANAPLGFVVASTTPNMPPYPNIPPYPTMPSSGGYPQHPPQAPYPAQTPGYAPPRCPSPNISYAQHPSAYPQQPSGYPQQPGGYPQQPGGYPQQPGAYPQQPSVYPQQPGGYPQQAGIYPQQPGAYPQQPGLYPQQPHGPAVSPSMQHKQKSGFLDKIGGVAGGAMTGAAGLVAMKHMKKGGHISKKAQKKALKYGLPIAGAGLGVYALKKTHGFGMFKGSSSSSSSSDSD